MEPKMKLAIFTALFVAGSPSLAENCDYFNATTGAVADGGCTVDWQETGATIRLGRATYEWVEQNRQGQWSVGLLDGQPAMRFEIDRTRYSYSTLDLAVLLEISN